jgi:acetoin:2,6-dichlorophenolindophenol oxidoreductase subunit beta
MREIYYLDAIKEALTQKMREDDSIFLIGEDIGVYGGGFGLTEGMLEEFGPNRIIDTPISEQGTVGIGIGASLMGMKPVVEIMFSDFLMLTLEQIANQAAKIRYMFGGNASVPLVIRTPGGGGTGAAAQHSQSIEAIVHHIPGLKVVMPSTPYDAKGLLISAINDPNPVIVFEHKLLYKKVKGDVPEKIYEVPLGKAEVKKQGKDLTVVATSYMVQKVLNVSEKLKSEDGIDIEVVDPRTLKPLDLNTIIESVKKTNRVLLVEEACYTGGFTSFLASEIQEKAFDWLDMPIKRITGLDTPIPYSKVLEDFVIPSEDRIEEGIKSVIS